MSVSVTEINSGDENKVMGHYIEEQAATDSFTDILEVVAPIAFNTIIAAVRERG